MRTMLGHKTAPKSWPAHGLTLHTASGYSPTARLPSQSSVTAARKVTRWSSCRTGPVYTTPSSAHSAPVIRGRCSVCRRAGTRALHTGLGWSPEPRAVLREFGLELQAETTIRIWDSTAEVRYLVLPERPSGTEDWDEEALAAIVTRDVMIGVAVPVVERTPA